MLKKIVKKAVKSIIFNIPIIGVYFRTNNPPGHFYSPVVSRKEMKEKEDFIYSNKTKNINNIYINEEKQMELIENFKQFYSEIPFKPEKTDNMRYYFENGFYSYSDGIFLYSFLRYFKPKRLIEIGSGFSSAVTLDTNEIFFNNNIKCTFIEPNPQRLYSIVRENEKKSIEIIAKEVQTVSVDKFKELESGDILFIDSSHVSKAGSDLNYIMFDILPVLNKGVFIHFHDIYFPLEYPRNLLFEDDGFGANEAYILRSFLMYNDSFEVVCFNTFLQEFNKEWFEKNMPLCLKNPGGNIWIRKIK